MPLDHFSRLQAHTTLVDLCNGLRIDGVALLCACADETNTRRRCGHTIMTDVVREIRHIRSKLAQLMFFADAAPYLEQLSRKLVCSQRHQSRSTVLFQSWQAKLDDPVRHRLYLLEALPRYYNNDDNDREETTFIRYQTSNSNSDPNENVRKTILSRLSKDEVANLNTPGTIYIFGFACQASTPETTFYKVGYSVCAKTRISQWQKQCGKQLDERVTSKTKLYKRVERLVHVQFESDRLTRDCNGCGRTHKEWFDMSTSDLAYSIELWSQWARQEPYNSDGRLKPEWEKRVKALDTNEVDCWDKFVRGPGSRPRRSSSIGSSSSNSSNSSNSSKDSSFIQHVTIEHLENKVEMPTQMRIMIILMIILMMVCMVCMVGVMKII